MSTEFHSEDAVSSELVEEQLVRIQNSAHFNHSRRYPGFLSYVVRKTLTGRQEDLKERTIGIEAFGRQPGYDLNADPVVRVTAGEVRKRLAQYYYEPEHMRELRIELRPGSYVPEFKLAPSGAASPDVAASPSLEKPISPEAEAVRPLVEDSLPSSVSDPAKASKERRGLLVGVAGSLLLIVSVLLAQSYLRTSAVFLFWRPLLAKQEPVLVLIGSVLAMTNAPTPGVSDASVGGHALHSDPVALSDTIALAKLQEVLAKQNKTINVQSSAQTSFSDLQKGPVVLISGFNNPWTMRLTDPLRFHFARPSTNTFEIEDRADPKRKWSMDTLLTLNKATDDYGLIARFNDPLTEQMVVVAAGIGENGTIAAAEVLSDERSLEELKRDGLTPGDKGNFEAVVQVRIIDGKPARPRVVATTSW